MSSPRVWFMTGCSTGFGRLMTELVLERGDVAVSTARKPEVLAGLAAIYPEDRLLILKLDAERRFGRIDVVFNNARFGILGELEGIPENTARGLFDVNFWGAVNVSKEAIRVFREVNRPQGGRLLQMSSMYGVEANPPFGIYSAAKFALEGFTESLAAEIDPKWEIKITLLEPGFFKTNLRANAVEMEPHPAYTRHRLLSATRLAASGEVFHRDPKNAVAAMYRLVSLPDPPLHFPLGEDAIVLKSRFKTEKSQSARSGNQTTSSILLVNTRENVLNVAIWRRSDERRGGTDRIEPDPGLNSMRVSDFNITRSVGFGSKRLTETFKCFDHIQHSLNEFAPVIERRFHNAIKAVVKTKGMITFRGKRKLGCMRKWMGKRRGRKNWRKSKELTFIRFTSLQLRRQLRWDGVNATLRNPEFRRVSLPAEVITEENDRIVVFDVQHSHC
ncbi:NAD(P)-binding protein [Laetiporus sulphureus 93-53]|uniref:NAD(P)-binding protein n=1 Tax=Laetiporus sulphureus 93-53 TaxID=1314785 RepID=A0A165DE77_9APHY|nr:NAD(P)-binding protein [Laetiporus sulphureus 93-53]KZT04686.1 NAD(P)-binding protein [Laetiporus sulphureus 93-53]